MTLLQAVERLIIILCAFVGVFAVMETFHLMVPFIGILLNYGLTKLFEVLP